MNFITAHDDFGCSNQNRSGYGREDERGGFFSFLLDKR